MLGRSYNSGAAAMFHRCGRQSPPLFSHPDHVPVVVAAHIEYHLLVSRLHKTALLKLFLEVCPCRLACQINDEINMIGGANILERYGIGDE